MIYLLAILWWLSGCISFLYILKEDGPIEPQDVGMSFIAGIVGPAIPLAKLTAWLMNKF